MTATAMTAADFTAWLAFMKMKKLAMNDAEAASRLGVHPNTLGRWKRDGAPAHIALACAAIYDGLPPFKAEHIFR